MVSLHPSQEDMQCGERGPYCGLLHRHTVCYVPHDGLQAYHLYACRLGSALHEATDTHTFLEEALRNPAADKARSTRN
jgi:hypothetical protein